MNDRIGLEHRKGLVDEAVVGEIAYAQLQLAARYLPPQDTAPVQRRYGIERLDAVFELDPALDEVIHHHDIVATGGKMHGGGPTEIAVGTEDQDSHEIIPSSLAGSGHNLSDAF